MIKTNRSNIKTRTTIGELNRFLTVSTDGSGNYTTIDAAVDAVNVIAPGNEDPVYIVLAEETHTLTDDQMFLPDNSGIIAHRGDPALTIIEGNGNNLGQLNGLIEAGANTLLEGFTIGPGAGNNGCCFEQVRHSELPLTISRVITKDEGDDVMAIRTTGLVVVQYCDITVKWDGLFWNVGGDVNSKLTVKNSYLHSGSSQTWHNLIRTGVDDVTIEILGCQLDSHAKSAGNEAYGVCVGQGTFTQGSDGPFTYNLIMKDSEFNLDIGAATPPVAGIDSYCVYKQGGTVESDNCQFNLTGVGNVVLGDDYALGFQDVSGSLTNSTVTADDITVAQAQNDVSGNSITGFPIV